MKIINKNPLMLKILQYFKTNTPPKIISKMGFFGSCITNLNTSDLDILLFIKPIKNTNNNLIIESITKTIKNEKVYNSKLLMDVPNEIKEYFENLSDVFKIQLRIGLGPAIKPPKTTYLHVNGIFTDSLWSLFCEKLPIHGAIISGNYLPIIGDKLKKVDLKLENFKEYTVLIEERFNHYQITSSYLRKYVKTIALLYGLNSADYKKCLDYLLKLKIITKQIHIQLININKTNELSYLYSYLKVKLEKND